MAQAGSAFTSLGPDVLELAKQVRQDGMHDVSLESVERRALYQGRQGVVRAVASRVEKRFPSPFIVGGTQAQERPAERRGLHDRQLPDRLDGLLSPEPVRDALEDLRPPDELVVRQLRREMSL